MLYLNTHISHRAHVHSYWHVLANMDLLIIIHLFAWLLLIGYEVNFGSVNLLTNLDMIYRDLDSFDKLKSWTAAAAMQGVDEEAHRPSEGGAWQRRFWSQHQKWHLQIIWNTAVLSPPSKSTFSHDMSTPLTNSFAPCWSRCEGDWERRNKLKALRARRLEMHLWNIKELLHSHSSAEGLFRCTLWNLWSRSVPFSTRHGLFPYKMMLILLNPRLSPTDA